MSKLTDAQVENNRRLDIEIEEARRHNERVDKSNAEKLEAWKKDPRYGKPYFACKNLDMSYKRVIGIRYVL